MFGKNKEGNKLPWHFGLKLDGNKRHTCVSKAHIFLFCFSKTTLLFAFLHVLLNFISPLNRILVSFSSKDVSFCYVIGNVFSNSTKRVIFIFLRMKFYLLHISMIINLIFLKFSIRIMKNLIVNDTLALLWNIEYKVSFNHHLYYGLWSVT